MLRLCFLLYTNTCCFLELILLFLKTCSVFLTPIADFPQVFQQVSQVPGSLLQMLKTHWETSLYVLGNQPCPTPHSATIKVSPMLESLIPRSNVFLFLALLLHFLKHLFQEHAIKKKYVETQFFEKLSI